MHITASSLGDQGAVRLEPRPFRAARDGVTAAGFVAVITAFVVTAVASSHAAAVLGAVYGSMALLVWVEAFRSSWAIGPDAVAARRWMAWRTLAVGDVTDVTVDPGEPGVDVSISGRRNRRVVVPLDEWRRHPGAVDQLRDFVARGERIGARVDPAVWRALERA